MLEISSLLYYIVSYSQPFRDQFLICVYNQTLLTIHKFCKMRNQNKEIIMKLIPVRK